jgi:nucleoside-diphosphate-sugar epimerase
MGIGRRKKAMIKELDAYYSVDLFSKASVVKLVTEIRPDVVIHLASQRFGSLKEVLDGNVIAADYLLEAMRESMGTEKRVIIIRSSAEIGYCSPKICHLLKMLYVNQLTLMVFQNYHSR